MCSFSRQMCLAVTPSNLVTVVRFLGDNFVMWSEFDLAAAVGEHDKARRGERIRTQIQAARNLPDGNSNSYLPFLFLGRSPPSSPVRAKASLASPLIVIISTFTVSHCRTGGIVTPRSTPSLLSRTNLPRRHHMLTIRHTPLLALLSRRRYNRHWTASLKSEPR